MGLASAHALFMPAILKFTKQADSIRNASIKLQVGYFGAGRLSAQIASAMADEACAMTDAESARLRLVEAKDHLQTARRLKRESR